MSSYYAEVCKMIDIGGIWTCCSESLPKKDKQVLMIRKNAYYIVSLKNKKTWARKWNKSLEVLDTDHWMKLPKPPVDF